MTDSLNTNTEDTPFSLEAVAQRAHAQEGGVETPFSALGLVKPLLKALDTDGYTTPTPIQTQAIPALLDGQDLIGCAQTGTGKTAAFALPLLQHLFRNPKAASSRCTRILVLSPTRELASQIHASFGTYGRFMNLRRTAIYGGVNSHQQIKTMARGVDVLVATPGRLLDLINQKRVNLEEVEALVLDEADRMLDMGFIHDIRKIAAMCPADRQTLMFSATMEPAIAKLAKALLHMPVRVDVAPQSTTAETVEQHVLFMERPEKLTTVIDMLQNGGRFGGIYKALIFTRTKHGANRLDAQLHKAGIKATAIHGNKSQNQRKKALEIFKKGHLQVMVATDVAARGLDIDDITHVINYDMPTEPDAYVHRIGRTGRAGAEGIAISLCDGSERGLLRDIERTIGKSLIGDAPPAPANKNKKKDSGPKGKGKKKSKFKGSKPHGEKSQRKDGPQHDGQKTDQKPNGSKPQGKPQGKPKRRRQNKRGPGANNQSGPGAHKQNGPGAKSGRPNGQAGENRSNENKHRGHKNGGNKQGGNKQGGQQRQQRRRAA